MDWSDTLFIDGDQDLSGMVQHQLFTNTDSPETFMTSSVTFMSLTYNQATSVQTMGWALSIKTQQFDCIFWVFK